MYDSVRLSVLQRHSGTPGYGFIPYEPLKRRHSAARSTCADVLGARFSPLGAGVWLAADVLFTLSPKADGLRLDVGAPTMCETAQRCGGSELEWLRARVQATQARPSQPHSIVALWCPCMRAVVWLIAAHVHTHPSAELKAVPYFALPFTP